MMGAYLRVRTFHGFSLVILRRQTLPEGSMATKSSSQKAKKSPAAKAEKKERNDKSTNISPHALEILEAAVSKFGCTKTDFASKAIIAYGRKKLGDAVPASPEEVLEARLGYLERRMSMMEWADMCEDKPKWAENLKRYVEKTGFSPYSRNFEELNKLRKVRRKDQVGDDEWVTAAFAVEFEYDAPPKVPDGDFDAEYLERNVSQWLWKELCGKNPGKAQRMYDIAEELELDSQNMLEECVALYKERHDAKVSDKKLWKTVALAVKFGFKLPGQKKGE